MTLLSFIKRVGGTYRPNEHAALDSEISTAQEALRLNTIAIESGARVIDRMKDDVLSNMSGMMRMVQRAERKDDQ
jgi:hypothetical protein